MQEPIVKKEGVRAFMEGILPSIILTQCLNQLPNILRLTSIYQGYTTTTAINRHVVGKYHLRVISIQTGILN